MLTFIVCSTHVHIFHLQTSYKSHAYTTERLPTQMGSHTCLHKLMYIAHLHTCNTYMPPHTVLTHLHTCIHSHVHTMHLPVDMHRSYAPHMCTPFTYNALTSMDNPRHMHKHVHTKHKQTRARACTHTRALAQSLPCSLLPPLGPTPDPPLAILGVSNLGLQLCAHAADTFANHPPSLGG